MTTATAARQRAHPPSRLLALTEPHRALGELAAFMALRPALSFLPRGDGHGVLVLPGFMAGDGSTGPMRRLLAQLGYDVTGWNLGRNLRVDNGRIEAMGRCVSSLHERTGGKISIIGWSLGGVFARELAKRIGAPLARIEMQVAMRVLFERLPRLRLARSPEYKDVYHFHGLDTLEVTW